MKKFIGFYDYTVILTYLGLVCALLGMICALKGHPYIAVLLLGGVLLCDTLDGKVARAKKNRTEDEKQFGVQIDSLCDLVSFGVFPSVLFYSFGLDTILDFVLCAIYCLCCVIRLAYFNVLAQKPEKEDNIFHGFPVVSLAIAVPFVYLIKAWIPFDIFLWMLRGMLALFSFLYIFDLRIKKANWVGLGILFLLFIVPYVILILR